jgi:hypothetical protein
MSKAFAIREGFTMPSGVSYRSTGIMDTASDFQVWVLPEACAQSGFDIVHFALNPLRCIIGEQYL